MKTKYTKKQIIESINYWKKQLNKINIMESSVNSKSLSPNDLIERINSLKKNNIGAEFNNIVVADKNQNKLFYVIDTYELPYNGGIGLICDFTKDVKFDECDLNEKEDELPTNSQTNDVCDECDADIKNELDKIDL